MKMPFTTQQFLEVFRRYNIDVFPLQTLFYGLAVLIIWQAFKGGARSNLIINLILSFFWLWMGVVYHMVYFSRVNKAAYLFGLLFIIQGFNFAYFGGFKKMLGFRFSMNGFSLAGLIFMLYSLVLYPLLGSLLGRVYPDSPTFGLPCPTTIFSFGILLMTNRRIPISMLIIPLVWTIVGSSAAYLLGVIEDFGLLVAGILGGVLIVLHNRYLLKNAKTEAV